MVFKLLDFVFPRFCIKCDTNGTYLCEQCRLRFLRRVEKNRCHVCSKIIKVNSKHFECKQKTALEGVLMCYEYNNLVETIVADIKYNFHFDVVQVIASDLARLIQTLSVEYDFLLPVPLSKKRQRWRGFNQAELICKNMKLPYRSDVLFKTKHTKTQVGLNRQDRLLNLENVFFAKDDVMGKVVIVVDDVMTTGATLENCAVALKNAGASKVYGLVWAHGL